jgi:hypothetical protein
MYQQKTEEAATRASEQWAVERIADRMALPSDQREVIEQLEESYILHSLTHILSGLPLKRHIAVVQRVRGDLEARCTAEGVDTDGH